MKLVIRPWKFSDAEAALKVRNHPALMRWFRQDEPIDLKDERIFINSDYAGTDDYNGQVVTLNGKVIGLCGVKDSKEFSIGILPEYQHRGIATKVMKHLIKSGPIWSEVFIGNPALNWFVGKLGFKILTVKERAYYKKGIGLVDIVGIYHE